MQNKHSQLGMNPSTASARLLKDLLFDFVQKNGDVCYRCGKPLTRDTFSIEHKKAWLDSEDPIGLFFDIDNIAYSHLFCNIGAARKMAKRTVLNHGTHNEYANGCRCLECREAHRLYKRSYTARNNKTVL